MNITSSVSVNGPAAIENLHRMYMQGKESPNENAREIKFKSKIRIKSKSQGKFWPNPDKNNNPDKKCNTINLVSLVKEAKNVQLLANINEEKLATLLPEEHKVVNQRELVFLKKLVDRRK